jgi:hypothetical protein
MNQKITLAGAEYPVAPIKFKVLRTVLPLFTRIGIDERGMEAMADIITAGVSAAGKGFSREDFDELAPTFKELQAAVNAIATISGLDVKGPESGEAKAAGNSDGATFTG